jgi:hypothetical protein
MGDTSAITPIPTAATGGIAYREFLAWLRKEYAEYGKRHTYFTSRGDTVRSRA